MFPRVLVLLVISNIAVSQYIIKTLPGFSGDLPFKLETGYVGVGYLDEVQLFYYFFESERSPKDDPLILWLTGGPGCSTFRAIAYEIGPIKVNYEKSSGGIPQFTLNPYSWTQVANIIFLDAPVGTGFSYATSWEGYNASDTISAAETSTFIRKWLMAHPKFLTNPLYIAGDSYSGKIVPIIVDDISNGNEVGHGPPLNLKGFVIGNPVTDEIKDENSRIPFAHLKGLLSDELYESLKRNCKEHYIDADTTNALCMSDLQRFVECTGKLDTAQILEPACPSIASKPNDLKWDLNGQDSTDFLLSTPQLPRLWCRNDNYLYASIWANDKTVQEALHIREGTVKEWARCNKSLSYTKNVPSSVVYHQNIIKRGYRGLVYSGDHDMLIPYVGTLIWINSLNLTIDYDWQPWFVDGQVAGYTVEYSQDKYYLTFATVKGGGHTAPEYKPKECLAMIYRWLAYYSL